METTETVVAENEPTSPSEVPAAIPARAPRGFAALSPERRRAIASKGGKAAHETGTAYEFTPEKAREAGQKGGAAPHVSRGRQKRPATPRKKSAAK